MKFVQCCQCVSPEIQGICHSWTAKVPILCHSLSPYIPPSVPPLFPIPLSSLWGYRVAEWQGPNSSMISSASGATSILIEHGRVWQSGTPASILDQHEAGSTQTGRPAFILSASADFGAGFFQHASSWGSKRSACLALFSNLAFFGVGAPRAESPFPWKDPPAERQLRSIFAPDSRSSPAHRETHAGK